MGLFRKKICSCCGKKLNAFSSVKLRDKNYLCLSCFKKLPSLVRKSFQENSSVALYNCYMDHIERSNSVFRPMFHETNRYYSIVLDRDNEVFFIGRKINSDTLFFHLRDVSYFDLMFVAEEYKQGIGGLIVKGNIIMDLTVQNPYFHHEEILCRNVRVKAKKVCFGQKIQYDSPFGMNEFLEFFLEACAISKEKAAFNDSHFDECHTEDEYEKQANKDNYRTVASLSELQQAMALFMIDKPEDITAETIRSQRNKLMKTFHPDVSSYGNTVYAQKINNAYEVLKKHLN